MSRKAIGYDMTSNGPGGRRHKSSTHIETSRGRCWPRGFGALNSSLTSVSLGSSFRFYLFTSAAGRIGTKEWHKTNLLRDASLLRSARRGAAQLHSVTEIAPPQPFSCVNRSPIPYDFRVNAKAIHYSLNRAFKSLVSKINVEVSANVKGSIWWNVLKLEELNACMKPPSQLFYMYFKSLGELSLKTFAGKAKTRVVKIGEEQTLMIQWSVNRGSFHSIIAFTYVLLYFKKLRSFK